MLSRLDIKKILKNVGSVSRSTLIKKANQLGLEVKKNVSDDKLRKQVLKEGERQIERYMDSLIKQYNEEKKQQRENLQYKTKKNFLLIFSRNSTSSVTYFDTIEIVRINLFHHKEIGNL